MVEVKPECKELYEIMKEKEEQLELMKVLGTPKALEEIRKEYEEAKRKFEECNSSD